MRVPLHPAFILHQRPYRETSKLLELFSSEHGRVAVVAKGARRRWRQEIQLFRSVQVAWTGRGELGTLTAVEPDSEATLFQPDTLASAFYVNELLVRLLPRHDPAMELFACYRSTIRGLSEHSEPGTILRRFEKQLLETLGYGLITAGEVGTGTPLVPDELYHYALELGPTRQKPSTEQALAVHGRTLHCLESGAVMDTQTLREAKHLMRFLLKPLLGDKPLASRELIPASSIDNDNESLE